jgi:SAM-dependent methyltransferase
VHAVMNIHIHHFRPGTAIDDQAALEQFQRQWATYQKLVDSDALSHKEVGGILHQTLKVIPQPFAFLDIACGDAGQMKQALGATKVKHYHGIDLSEPALELAAKNLAGVSFEVELDHRDFVDALERRPEAADAAWCGLSIHHLSTEGKAELLKAIHGSTSKMLMVYEPTLADGEDREAYLQRFRRVNRPAWPFLTDEEWQQIDHHVTTCDFPESAATWLDLGRAAGFSTAKIVFRDPTGFYNVYRYDR